MSHEMLQVGPTVVGCCVDGVAQPRLISSEIMSRNARCLVKIARGFVKCLKVRMLLERVGLRAPSLLMQRSGVRIKIGKS